MRCDGLRLLDPAKEVRQEIGRQCGRGQAIRPTRQDGITSQEEVPRLPGRQRQESRGLRRWKACRPSSCCLSMLNTSERFSAHTIFGALETRRCRTVALPPSWTGGDVVADIVAVVVAPTAIGLVVVNVVVDVLVHVKVMETFTSLPNGERLRIRHAQRGSKGMVCEFQQANFSFRWTAPRRGSYGTELLSLAKC